MDSLVLPYTVLDESDEAADERKILMLLLCLIAVMVIIIIFIFGQIS